ncbi:unnamed protein product [Owenia fusiformis]|uniref:Structure-specific endonuclease subunit SLX4 n=1 Tax=Owenia fusiformis TaxID=6347 RepID=A0A8J1TIG9_OWEFU|nr:unnamed protein product [Owenia fusiformis]
MILNKKMKSPKVKPGQSPQEIKAKKAVQNAKLTLNKKKSAKISHLELFQGIFSDQTTEHNDSVDFKQIPRKSKLRLRKGRGTNRTTNTSCQNESDISQSQEICPNDKVNDGKANETDCKTRETDCKTRETDFKTRETDCKTRATGCKTRETDFKTKENDCKTKENDCKGKKSITNGNGNDRKAEEDDHKTRSNDIKTKENSSKPKIRKSNKRATEVRKNKQSKDDKSKKETLDIDNTEAEDDMKAFDDNTTSSGAGAQDDSDKHEEVTEGVEVTKQCTTCGKNINTIEHGDHILKCLQDNFRRTKLDMQLDTKHETKTSPRKEENQLFLCQFCNKDLTSWNSRRRQQHLNRCLDQIEEGERYKEAKEKVVNKMRTSVLPCPICGQPHKTDRARKLHLKKCALQYDVPVDRALKLAREQEEEHKVKLDQGQLIIDEKDVQKLLKTTKPKTAASKHKKAEPKSVLEEQTQLAIALSVSASEFSTPMEFSTPNMENANTSVFDVLMKNAKDQSPVKKGKRKKKTEVIPELLKRTREENEEIVASRAAIVTNQTLDVEVNELTPRLPESLFYRPDNAEPRDLTAQFDKESTLWQMSKFTEADKAKEDFYVASLCDVIEPCDITTGSKMKHLSQIPGRRISSVQGNSDCEPSHVNTPTGGSQSQTALVLAELAAENITQNSHLESTRHSTSSQHIGSEVSICARDTSQSNRSLKQSLDPPMTDCSLSRDATSDSQMLHPGLGTPVTQSNKWRNPFRVSISRPGQNLTSFSQQSPEYKQGSDYHQSPEYKQSSVYQQSPDCIPFSVQTPDVDPDIANLPNHSVEQNLNDSNEDLETNNDGNLETLLKSIWEDEDDRNQAGCHGNRETSSNHSNSDIDEEMDDLYSFMATQKSKIKKVKSPLKFSTSQEIQLTNNTPPSFKTPLAKTRHGDNSSNWKVCATSTPIDQTARNKVQFKTPRNTNTYPIIGLETPDLFAPTPYIKTKKRIKSGSINDNTLNEWTAGNARPNNDSSESGDLDNTEHEATVEILEIVEIDEGDKESQNNNRTLSVQEPFSKDSIIDISDKEQELLEIVDEHQSDDPDVIYKSDEDMFGSDSEHNEPVSPKDCTEHSKEYNEFLTKPLEVETISGSKSSQETLVNCEQHVQNETSEERKTYSVNHQQEESTEDICIVYDSQDENVKYADKHIAKIAHDISEVSDKSIGSNDVDPSNNDVLDLPDIDIKTKSGDVSGNVPSSKIAACFEHPMVDNLGISQSHFRGHEEIEKSGLTRAKSNKRKRIELDISDIEPEALSQEKKSKTSVSISGEVITSPIKNTDNDCIDMIICENPNEFDESDLPNVLESNNLSGSSRGNDTNPATAIYDPTPDESTSNNGPNQYNKNDVPNVSTSNESSPIDGPSQSNPNDGPDKSNTNDCPSQSNSNDGPNESTINDNPDESTPNDGPSESTSNDIPNESTNNKDPDEYIPNEDPNESTPNDGPNESTPNDGTGDLNNSPVGSVTDDQADEMDVWDDFDDGGGYIDMNNSNDIMTSQTFNKRNEAKYNEHAGVAGVDKDHGNNSPKSIIPEDLDNDEQLINNDEQIPHNDDKEVSPDDLDYLVNDSALWRDENEPSFRNTQDETNTAVNAVPSEQNDTFPEQDGSSTEPLKTPNVPKPRASKSWVPPSPFTPMPDYDAMATPAVKREIAKHGVRMLPKKKMIMVLKNIYQETHQYETDSECDASFTGTNAPGLTNESTSNKETGAKSKSVSAKLSVKESLKPQGPKSSSDITSSLKVKPLVTKTSSAKPSFAKTSSTKPLVAKTSSAKPLVAKTSSTKPLIAKSLAAKTSSAKPSLVAKTSSTKSLVAKTSSAQSLVAKTSSTKSLVTKTSSAKPLVARVNNKRLLDISDSDTSDNDDDIRDNDDPNSDSDDAMQEETIVEEPMTASQQVSTPGVKQKIYDYITSTESIHLKVLYYEPIDFDDFQAELLTAGIRCGKQKLMEILDEKCITFTCRSSSKAKREKKQQRKKTGSPRKRKKPRSSPSKKSPQKSAAKK